jgi:hypothetical protein
MSNIRLRSPYRTGRTDTTNTSTYAELEITIEGTLRYTLRKDVDSNYFAYFEISELVRDYLDITFDGTYPTGTNSDYVDITTVFKFYNSDGTQVHTTETTNLDGFDAYSEFSEGNNVELGEHTLAQSNTTIYVPENTAGQVPYFDTKTGLGAGIYYESFGTTSTSLSIPDVASITIERVCETRYTEIKVTFINKFGAKQDVYFFKKSIETLNVNRQKFNRSILNTSTASFDTKSHQHLTFDVVGNESIVMNTGFVDEGMTEVIKQLMLSEQVWATIDSTIYPIRPTDTSFVLKNSVYDRVINHTVRFDYAFDLINNIR